MNKNSDSIISKKNTIIKDEEKNIINLENFDYQKKNKIFKSIGLIRIKDKYNNTYNFSQIYIDTQIGEILGSDVSSYLNDEKFKVDSKNNPRIMANTFTSNKDISSFTKSIFTLCGFRKNKDGKMCALLGPYKLAKCCMIIRKRFIMITQ